MSNVTWWIVFNFGGEGIDMCLLCLVILHELDEELESLGVALGRELSGGYEHPDVVTSIFPTSWGGDGSVMDRNT
ncbi:unnamed protein product [Prunus armeniaca]